MTLLLLSSGLVLLILGADLLIRGASAIAAAFGVPSLVIGMTIVAFGTSTPEVVLNILAASKGETSLAFGNIAGACIVNICIVLGLTAMIRPLQVEKSIIAREIPLMILAALAFLVIAGDGWLNHRVSDVLDRSDGLVLILFFCVFLYSSVMQFVHRAGRDTFVSEVTQAIADPSQLIPSSRKPFRPIDIALTIGGLVAVSIGARLVVANAVILAKALGISDAVVGLTIVSFGTTLPELATCIQAARRGQSDIVLGNVIGSNIFNMLFIAGTAATISPIPVPPGGMIDVSAIAILCIILFPIALRGPRRITRGEGAFLFSLYPAYLLIRWRLAS